MSSADQRLDRYDIISRIAVGGMAEVFRAKAYGAHGFEKTLAIKRILPRLAQDPEFESRFITEAKLAVQLAHANIVQVFDFGKFGDSLFIAMEFVDGVDLAALLGLYRERKEVVGVGAALHIGIELCKGLDFAHRRGVVHRDVSPSNVLLSRAGEVKVADFGIAQVEREIEREADPSQSQRRIMGKWRYMSPEQTRGDPLTAQSDLFSAAVLIYELLTGEKLFPGSEAEQISRNIQTMSIPKASDRRPQLPDGVDDVLMRALERNPSARWERAADMQRAFTELSYERSIVASALDVEDAVKRVVGEGSSPALVSTSQGSGSKAQDLDAMIRLQLNASMQEGTARKTIAEEEPDESRFTERDARAVGVLQGTGTATIVKRGMDVDGVTMWEIDATIADGPAAMRAEPGRSKRETERVPSLHDTPQGGGRRGKRFGLAVGLAAVAALGMGAGLVYVMGEPDQPVVADAPAGTPAENIDAGSGMMRRHVESGAVMEIDSEPRGASVWIDSRPVGQTPVEVRVTVDVVHRLEVILPGFVSYADDVKMTAGERLRVRPVLSRAGAGLRVRSRPDGAVVRLDGTQLGKTPLELTELEPVKGLLEIDAGEGYRTARVEVDLVAGEIVEVERSLSRIEVYGKINLHIEGSWADVYFRGKKVARAPVKGLKLPLGRHRLTLKNPASGQKKVVVVEVDDSEVNYYSERLSD